MVETGQAVELTIEKPAAGGRMIARLDGQVVLVSGAIPGEQVTARIERVGRGVAYADVLTVDRPSLDRRAAGADPLCGGCIYAHIAYPRQIALKAAVIEDALTRIGRVAVPNPMAVMPSPETGYRLRARLHVRGGRVGFFREGTHDLCDARQTGQLGPRSCDALDRLAAGLRSLGVTNVRETELAENVDATARVVHLEASPAIDPRSIAALGTSEGLTGLTTSGPSDHRPVTVVSGSPYVVDEFDLEAATVRLRRHVLAFFQGNRFLLRPLVSHVLSHIETGDQVVDLYAGTGLFAVSAAISRNARVTAIEGDRLSAGDLQANAATAGDLVSAVHGSVEQSVAQLRDRPSVLIVDPPRTGMSTAALTGAIELGATTIVYVSCDVATLARDSRRLIDAGYTLERVAGFDLFPNTPHVESVATFRRA
jgi:23S rRNA (uracil1939-C5)-methyltransferase